MFLHQDNPIVAIATAPGRGAVGIVRLSGKELAPLAQELLGQVPRARHAAYLDFLDAQGNSIDRGLALFFPAPYSYTGEDVLELQGHGGSVVLELLVQRCLEIGRGRGLRLAQPGEFTQRAFLNGKLDLAQAEAVADLIDASTQAAARSATRSLSGAFSHQVQSLSQELIHLRMLVEATLDFPEEEVDFLERANALERLQGLARQLEGVLSQTRQGALLREGIKVVIAGQPNAGKSSLLNALAGAELAIVTPIAGTTRDKVQETIQINGVPLHVIDTAGLRQSRDEVERIGIERAWEEIRRADAVLFLHDLTRQEDAAYQADDAAIAQDLAINLPQQVPVVHVWNKADAVPSVISDTNTDTDTDTNAGLMLSAKQGQGLEALRQRLLEIAGWQSGAGEGLYLARARHVEALVLCGEHMEQALELLISGLADGHGTALELVAEELRLAHDQLGLITGKFSADDLLGVIFSSFCIGK